MKIKKVENLVADLHEKTEYVVHIRNLKQTFDDRQIKFTRNFVQLRYTRNMIGEKE